MSDTCYLGMSFRKEDLPKFETVLQRRMYDGKFWDEEDSDEKEMNVTIYEANYGWYDEINDMAAEGLTFRAFHESGSAYGPCNYACYKGDLEECNADFDGTPIINVTKEGADPVSLAHSKKYFAILEKIESDEG